MSESIVWVVMRFNASEPARQASNINLAFVQAVTPEAARAKCEEANPYGERYQAPNYCVVSLEAFMRQQGGVALVRGDLPSPVMWPEGASYVF